MVKAIEYTEIIKDFFIKITIWVSGLGIITLMLLNTMDVIFRNLFSFSISGSYELSEFYLMPIITFPILAYTYSKNILPRLDSFVIKLDVNKQWILSVLFYVIEAIIFLLFTYYGWKYAVSGTINNMSFNAGGKMYPIYPLYYLVPFGFGVLSLEVILRLLNQFNPLKKDA